MNTLLVANRGEIAVRVIRAAREMGLRTVAVASEADAHAAHAKLADTVVDLGPSDSRESYLRTDKILAACRETGADAVHPGYGFLSENADFAEACEAAGVTFVGPPASAMRALGAKIPAKELARSCGVPTVPGFFEAGSSDAQLRAAADAIGYPVMLKASAGGGGRGMRVVRTGDEFNAALSLARSEAVSAFGDGAMMVEKLVQSPRHIEVQLLADRHGNVAVLFERECSVQRRHQKLIEEAPSPLFAAPSKLHLWETMRRSAIELAKAAGYVGAGTVEFIYDPEAEAVYFLEVNARLQVEHPVTEQITGVDLVQWQLRIADGERLNLTPNLFAGDRSAIRGHAVEVRVVSEDPARGFMPASGRLLGWAEPSGPGIRVDTGYGPGAEVPRFYDSLLAKAITSGETRNAAIRRMEDALLDFHILGVPTNIEFMLSVLEHPAFLAGTVDTGFVDREMSGWKPREDLPPVLGALCRVFKTADSDAKRAVAGPWALADGWRVARSG